MSTLVITLLIAVLLPYVVKLPLAYAMARDGGYDNCYPRDQQARLTGFGARALGAHQNSFESLAVYSTAALTCLATNHITPTIEYLAMGYIATRVIYYFMYWFNWSTLRSTFWFLGTLASVVMIWECIP